MLENPIQSNQGYIEVRSSWGL